MHDGLLCQIKKEIDLAFEKNALNITDCFEFEKKIEYMSILEFGILSLSFTDSMSYDFTIFSLDGNKIIYNNTIKVDSQQDLGRLITNDLFAATKLFICEKG